MVEAVPAVSASTTPQEPGHELMEHLLNKTVLLPAMVSYINLPVHLASEELEYTKRT